MGSRDGLYNQQAKDLTVKLQIGGISPIEQDQPTNQQATELTESLKSEELKAGIPAIQSKQ
jgi:hypothetical protein